jgi:cysteine desulfurase/selenocysteine lyase
MWEKELLAYGTSKLQQIPGLTLIGSAKEKVCVFSFILEGIHPHDVGQLLDSKGIAVRTGHHCTQPVMDRFNIAATTRASLAFYNSKEEIGRLANALAGISEMFK